MNILASNRNWTKDLTIGRRWCRAHCHTTNCLKGLHECGEDVRMDGGTEVHTFVPFIATADRNRQKHNIKCIKINILADGTMTCSPVQCPK